MPLSIRQGDPAPYLDFDPPRKCPLCAGNDHVLLSRKMQFGLDCTTVICRSCGFCFVSPAPKHEVYHRFYRDGYAHFYRKIHRATSSETPVEHPVDKQRLDTIENWQSLRGLRVLEVGPGNGRFLRLAAARGARCSAVEPSIEFRRQLEAQGIEIIGDIVETAHTDEPYDVVMMFQVLEHFHEPVAAMSQVRDKLLRPGGLLVLDVPNIWKPFRSLDRYFLRYVHLSYFSPRTLERFLTRCGFTVVAVDEGGDSLLTSQPLFVMAVNRYADADITVMQDDWRQLQQFLHSYRRRYPVSIAPRLHLRLVQKRLRRMLSGGPAGSCYRWLKSVFS